MNDIIPGRLATHAAGYFTKICPCAVKEPYTVLVDVRDLVDGWNPLDAYVQRISKVIELLRQGENVIVACSRGKSRSMAIAAGALVEYSKMTLDNAVLTVNRKGAGIRQAHLQALAQLYAE